MNFSLLPIPPADGLHPIVVHFPIALLLIAPVFIVLAMLIKSHERGLWLAGLVTLAMGVASAFVATSTGESAEHLAEAIPGAEAVLEHHEDLAELARNLFAGLAVLLAIIVAARFVTRTPRRAPFIITGALYLALHAGASLVLANAAHEGGRLVHEYGVRANLTGSTAPAPGPAQETHNDDD